MAYLDFGMELAEQSRSSPSIRAIDEEAASLYKSAMGDPKHGRTPTAQYERKEDGVSKSLFRRRGLVLALVVALMSSLAASAQGKPLERERIHEVGSEVIEDFCGIEGLTVLEQFDRYINITFNQRGKDKIAYFTGTIHGWTSWTNVANDKTLTVVDNFVDKDQKITDNDDGTLTILVLGAGSTKVYGPDGKLLFNDPGQTRFEVLIDHNGTPSDPSDDEFLEFLGVVKGSTGRNDLEGRDFCEDIQTFIG